MKMSHFFKIIYFPFESERRKRNLKSNFYKTSLRNARDDGLSSVVPHPNTPGQGHSSFSAQELF